MTGNLPSTIDGSLTATGSLYLIIFAAIVMLLLIACPQGMSGLIERGWAWITGRNKAGGGR